MSLNTKIKKAFKFIFNSDYRYLVLAGRGKKANVPDEKFLKRMYKIQMGKELNLESPKAYTEKLQWLKLFDHREIYSTMVDKYAVKEYVKEKIGEEYLVPLLGVWDRTEDIDFSKLPEKFVLKTTHDSGGIVVCKDKSKLDTEKAKKKLEGFRTRNYYGQNRAWPYKNVPHRIIAEKYMEDSEYKEHRDYKFFTFGGEPKVLYIAQGRGTGKETVADFFDMEYNHLPFTIDHNMAKVPPKKPENFLLMQQLARILAKGTPQLRVDFYEVDGKVYFGEMTFFHCSGMEAFHPEEWDYTFGSWVSLPEKSGGK